MITIRRRLLWALGCGGLLLVAAAWRWHRIADRPQLPAMARYRYLPDAFNQALQATRERVQSSGNEADSVRRLARLYLANRLFEEARTCFAIVSTCPGGLGPSDHYYLAHIDQNENDLERAQMELRAVVQAEPRYLPARLALAVTLFKSGREEEAKTEYSAILGAEANQPEASIGLARIELQRGEDAAAVARLEDLMAAHPESTAGAALFAEVLERRGESDRAVAMTQWSQQKPQPPVADPWKDALLADCYDIQHLSITFEEYFKAGRMKEALPLLDRLATLDPSGPIPKIFAGFSHARALQHITAIRNFYEALGQGGDPEKICPSLAQSLLALGKVTEAAKLLADYHRKMPDSLPLTKAYCNVALQQGDEKLARALLEKVLQKEPYLQAENMSLAKILWTSGQRDEAAKCLLRIAGVYANDLPSRALLGQYYLEKGEPFSAIKPLEQAEKYAPARTPAEENLTAMLDAAYVQAGNVESEKGNLPAAVDLFDKSLRRDPSQLEAYAGKANALVRLGQFGPAAAALQKMAALDPDNPTIQLSLGDVLYQDGAKAEARSRWGKALELTAAGDSALHAAIMDRLGGHVTAETFK